MHNLNEINALPIKHRSFFQRWICAQNYHSPIFQSLLKNPELAFAEPYCLHIRKDDTNTLAKIAVEDHCFMVKRNNFKSFWHALKRLPINSRAMKNWAFAHQLIKLGISTPEPVAAIEENWGPINIRSYYFYHFADGLTADEFFTQVTDQAQLRAVAEQIALIFKKLFQNQLYHSDTKPTNFVIENGHVILIDIEALRQPCCGSLSMRQQRKSIHRFLNWWQAQPELLRLFQDVFVATGLPV